MFVLAIPSLKLSKTNKDSSSADSTKQRSERLAVRNKNRLVKYILENVSENTGGSSNVTISSVSPSVSPPAPVATTSCSEDTSEERYNILLQNYNKLLAENESLKKQCVGMQDQSDKLKKKLICWKRT